MIRKWKRWEGGESEPDDFTKPLLAKTFGTVTAVLFPSPRLRDRTAGALASAGLDTLEIVARLRSSDVSASTLEAMRVTTDQLCCAYPHESSDQLRQEGQQWLHRMLPILEGRLTLDQHREVLSLAGNLALLVGCVEYDMGLKTAAETTRKAALTLGAEAGDAHVVGWAHEMRAWYSLTQGDYRGTIAASLAGQAAAPQHGVAVQLATQRAKAWARLRDRRQVETALDEGRSVLEGMVHPDNLDHHFVVDPAKFDLYAMDCYRVVGEDLLAENYAHQVLASGTDFDGIERSPMRNAEARVTLGVVAARRGDLEAAAAHGRRALAGTRQSLPHLLSISRELAQELRARFPDDPLTADYLEHLRTLTDAAQ
jgi:hypothetical protein